MRVEITRETQEYQTLVIGYRDLQALFEQSGGDIPDEPYDLIDVAARRGGRSQDHHLEIGSEDVLRITVLKRFTEKENQ